MFKNFKVSYWQGILLRNLKKKKIRKKLINLKFQIKMNKNKIIQNNKKIKILFKNNNNNNYLVIILKQIKIYLKKHKIKLIKTNNIVYFLMGLL